MSNLIILQGYNTNLQELCETASNLDKPEQLVDAFIDGSITRARIQGKILGSFLFSQCNKLEEIVAPNVETIGENAFYNCYSLKDIYIPNTKTIGANAFYSCRSTKKIDFLNLETIQNSAFSNCYDLKALILRSEEPCSIGQYVFSSCYHFTGTNGDKDGYVYVPRRLISNYLSMENWAALGADRFRALEDYTIDGTIMGQLDETKI